MGAQRLGDKDERAINRAMQLAEVSAFSDRRLDALSSGERSRVLIARELATEPTAILAGEPVAALDPYHQFYTMEILREHCARDGTGLVVLHDLAIAARFCHRLVLLDKGRIVWDGKPEDVLQPQQLLEVYGIEATSLHTDAGLLVSPRGRARYRATNHVGLPRGQGP